MRNVFYDQVVTRQLNSLSVEWKYLPPGYMQRLYPYLNKEWAPWLEMSDPELIVGYLGQFIAKQGEYVHGMLAEHPEQFFEIIGALRKQGIKFTLAQICTEHDFDVDGAAAVLTRVDKAEYYSRPECFHNRRYKRFDVEFFKSLVCTPAKRIGILGDGIRSGPVAVMPGHSYKSKDSPFYDNYYGHNSIFFMKNKSAGLSPEDMKLRKHRRFELDLVKEDLQKN